MILYMYNHSDIMYTWGTLTQDMYDDIPVGPNLGLVKSSSLESLHNVMAHSIKKRESMSAADYRGREGGGSFRQNRGRPYLQQGRPDEDDEEGGDEDDGEGEQRGVDSKRIFRFLL